MWCPPERTVRYGRGTGKNARLRIKKYCSLNNADVVELVDTLDLGSSAARRGGSTPFIRTKALRKKSLFVLREEKPVLNE